MRILYSPFQKGREISEDIQFDDCSFKFIFQKDFIRMQILRTIFLNSLHIFLYIISQLLKEK